ncbi:hypothetical protein [Nocardia grenadensis]|uniref:hypothetical protein n=1 Tax=Nocardia grenadensis TaxID=931537 RepID=UPI003D706274
MIDKDGYDRFPALSQEGLERYCYLDDEDRRLLAGRVAMTPDWYRHPGGHGAQLGHVPDRPAGRPVRAGRVGDLRAGGHCVGVATPETTRKADRGADGYGEGDAGAGRR